MKNAVPTLSKTLLHSINWCKNQIISNIVISGHLPALLKNRLSLPDRKNILISGLILLWSFDSRGFLSAQNIVDVGKNTDASVAPTVSNPASTADLATVTNKKTPTGEPSSPTIKDKTNTAIEQIAVSEISEFTFEQLLARRKPELSLSEVRLYENELRARPELKGAEILSADDARVRKLRETARPVLESFGRRNYTQLFIYKADAPFIGLYRECIIIFSTGALSLLNESQKRAAVAHELAHEILYR